MIAYDLRCWEWCHDQKRWFTLDWSRTRLCSPHESIRNN